MKVLLKRTPWWAWKKVECLKAWKRGCGRKFILELKDRKRIKFASDHGDSWEYVRCPKCGGMCCLP